MRRHIVFALFGTALVAIQTACGVSEERITAIVQEEDAVALKDRV